ncbi:MAG: general secretion pathway protein GspC [Myxococcaceae bacterium]|nr:general secretion pathway protein GspC [Myxococcaceae bacterium]
MELLFKKHFWVVHLIFIFLVALLVARMVNGFLEPLVMPAPAGAKNKVAPRIVQQEQMAALNLERVAAVTGLPVPKEPEITEPVQGVLDPNAQPVRTGLRLKLLGTLLSGLPEWSMSSIQDVSTQKTATYMVGDLVMGATILEIERERVIINNNNHKEFIDGSAGDGAAAAVYTPPPSAPSAPAGNNNPPPSVALGSTIKKTGENEYEVPRAEVDKTLANLNDVAMQARIVPSFENGVANGFKLFSIRPDSIYSKLGIQNGDVIKRINGYDMNSPEKALELYTKLKESSRLEFEVLRNGSTVKSTVSIPR